MIDKTIILLQLSVIVLLVTRIVYMNKKAKLIDKFIRDLIATGKSVCFSDKKPENPKEYRKAGAYHALSELEKAYSEAMEEVEKIEK